MVVKIKNQRVEDLLEEIVKMTGESKAEALLKALEERYQRLALSSTTPMTPDEDGRLQTFLAQEIWPQIPAELLGSTLSKEEIEEKFLGLGESGV